MTQAGHDVTLIDQWPEHVEAIRAKGLRLSGTIGDLVVPVKALHMHELQHVRRAVRRGLRRREVLRHRVGARRWPCRISASRTAWWSTSRTGSTTSAWPRWRAGTARSAASSRSARGCTSRATPCARTPRRSASRSASTTARDTPRARELAAIVSAVAETQGHDQSLGRALVEARHQLHGESARRPHRPRHAGRADRSRRSPPSACISAPRRSRWAARVGHEVEPIYGIPAQRYVDAYAGHGARRAARRHRGGGPRARRRPAEPAAGRA